MSSDQFALWLNNRHLFDELDDDTLNTKQNEIITFFGGFRTMINICLCHQFSIDLPNHQQLFTLLNEFLNEQKIKLSKKSIKKKQIVEKCPFNLLNVNDIAISIIFTFLGQDDHISFQKSCKTLTVIGRKKESLNYKHDTLSFVHQFQHKLPYIMHCIQSNNPNEWRKAITVTQDTLEDTVTDRPNGIKTICHSGIIPSFLTLSRKCMMSNKGISADILSMLYYWLLTPQTINTFIKCNIFQLLKDIIANCKCESMIIKRSCSILHYIHSKNANEIILNDINCICVLVNNITKFNSLDFGKIFTVIGNLITHSSFDCDLNINIVKQLTDIQLFECIKKYMETSKQWEIDQEFIQDENDNEFEIWTHGNEIVNLYSQINQKYDVQFDVYDTEKMSLILFLLKHTQKAVRLGCINRWLSIDIALLIDKNIAHFIVEKTTTLGCFGIYLELLQRINECPVTIERHNSFKILKTSFFSQVEQFDQSEWIKLKIIDCLRVYFNSKYNSSHSIDFMEEFTDFYKKLIEILKGFRSAGSVHFLVQLQGAVTRFLIDNNNFGKMILNALNKNTKRTLKFILKAMELNHFVLIITRNKYKIYKVIINCCYSKYNILAIKCCLKSFDLGSHDKWESNGVLYAFQDFLANMNDLDQKHRQRYLQEILSVMGHLDKYTDIMYWMNQHQLVWNDIITQYKKQQENGEEESREEKRVNSLELPK